MIDDQIKDPERLPNKGAPPSDPDERDATIERLERAVAEERQHAEMLRKTVEDLRFKAEILEKSYTKQLEDTRLRAETAEREFAELQAQIAELETAQEETTKLLTQARGELARTPGHRDQLPQAPVSTSPTTRDDAESQIQEGTINRLMRVSSRSDERKPTREEKERAEAQARANASPPPEDMIAPELVLAVKDEDS